MQNALGAIRFRLGQVTVDVAVPAIVTALFLFFLVNLYYTSDDKFPKWLSYVRWEPLAGLLHAAATWASDKITAWTHEKVNPDVDYVSLLVSFGLPALIAYY